MRHSVFGYASIVVARINVVREFYRVLFIKTRSLMLT